MSGKTDKKIRKIVNKKFKEITQDENAIANNLIIELMNSSFRYRFGFALALIFRRKKKWQNGL